MGYVFSMVVLAALAAVGVALTAARLRSRARGEGMPPLGEWLLGACVFLAASLTLLASWTQVPAGQVGVQTLFGRVLPEPLGEGLSFTSPLVSVVRLDAAQRVIDVRSDERGGKSGPAATAMTRDQIGLPTLDVGFPYGLNPALAPKVYARFRGRYEQTVLMPAAQFAVREAAARTTWLEAAITAHDGFARALQSEFSGFVERNLAAVGFTPAEAKAAFVFPGVQLRAVLPPQRILAANAEYQAAQVDLRRQDTLNQIAQKQAERRGQEGQGIDNLFARLPKGYNADDVYKIMMAVAAKENADALMRAVEEGKVNLLALPFQTGITPPSTGLVPPPPAAK